MERKYGKNAACILTWASACILFLGMSGIVFLAGSGVSQADNAVQVYYIHNNPCESCREYLHFVQEFRDKISGEVPSEAYHMQELNLLLDSSKNTYDKLMKELDIPVKERITPMLIIGESYLTGSGNIEKNMKDLLLKESGLAETIQDRTLAAVSERTDKRKTPSDRQQIPRVLLNNNDSYLLYFSTTACESCEKADSFIESLPETFQVVKEGKGVTSKLVTEERNITQEGNLALYQEFLAKYRVPEKGRVVPIVFYQEGYLSGKDAILSGLKDILDSGRALGFTGITAAGEKEAEGLTFKDIPKILAAGLAGGLNPCSFSMLFLLLSLIAAKKSSVLKLGGVYLASKLIAYLVIALSFYHILNVLESGIFASIQEIIRILLIAAAFLFAAFSFLDFFKARKAQYGKMLLKLPKKIRNSDINIMQKLINNSKKPLWIVVFLLGFIISAGEFLCTGQVYLATLLTMNRLDIGAGQSGYFLILFYILAMLLPSLCVVILVHRGKRLQVISDFIVGHTGIIKLVNMLVFLLMGIIFLIY